MLVAIIYPPKEPAETWIVEVDFSELLIAGETIQSCHATSKLRADGSDTTAKFLSGSAAVDSTGALVRQRIMAGVDGDIHRIQFGITTISPYGNTWFAEVDVPVKDLST